MTAAASSSGASVARAPGLGELPRTAFLAALGLLVVATGDTLARLDIGVAPIVWWLGLLLIVTPVAARLIGREAERRERLALVILVGLALYGVKVMGAPSSFSMLDEFLHWATLDDIVVSGHLFTTNNILLASPYYPGLEIASDLLVRTGFSTWEAGILVVGFGRVLMMLALFLLYERASGDSRLAAVGALVYAANPGFLFFDSQFGYESLALPLAIFTLWCIQRREVATGAAMTGKPGRGDEARMTRLARAGHPLALTAALVLAIGAVVVTHHVTAMALSGCLILWAIVGTVLRLRGGRPTGLVGPAAMTVIATSAWLLYVASVTVGYLVPALSGAIDQVLNLIAGDEGSRELFRSATGVAAPAWEQIVGYASVAVMVLALPIALPMIWRRWRTSALPLTLAIIALLFPVSLLARLTARGAELAQRSAEFIFVGAAFVAALAALAVVDTAAHRAPPEGWRSGTVAWLLARLHITGERARRFGTGAVMTGLIMLFMGGAILGIAPWARMPGPYLVAADPRSVSPQGIDAATWTLGALGPGRRFLSDRTSRVLLATYGRQHPISSTGDKVNLRSAYFDDTLTPDDQDMLTRVGVEYVIADHRLPTSLPYVGVYVERGEQFTSGPWTVPMDAAALDKWAALPGADRVYDNGALEILDIRRLTGRAQ
jgi:hypothetical protein